MSISSLSDISFLPNTVSIQFSFPNSSKLDSIIYFTESFIVSSKEEILEELAIFPNVSNTL